MKIAVVHQQYLLPGRAGGSRFNEFARLWASWGHDVTVIAGNLDHLSGEIPAAYGRRWNVLERDGDVNVWRCHVPSTYSKGYAGRAWSFLGFTASSATAALRIPRPDVVVATSPPLFTAVPGWVSARLRGIPWVFEVRDLWPESAVTTGVLPKGGVIARGLYVLEREAYRRADVINVLTPAFRTDILERGLAASEKIVFVPNGADVEAFYPGPRENAMRADLGWGDRFVALYAGAHGRANALDQLLRAARATKDDPFIFWACVGDGTERSRLAAVAREEGLTNIAFHGAFAKNSMRDIVNAADVGLAVLQDNPTFRTVYPNKVFDYMACERPVILAIDGVARELVCDAAGAGLFVPPEDGPALARAVRSLRDDPSKCQALGRSGRTWALANASREGLARRYLDILTTLVASKRAGASKGTS